MVHYTLQILSDEGFVFPQDEVNNLKCVIAWVDPNNSESFQNWEIDKSFKAPKHYVSGMGCVCGSAVYLDEYRIKHIKTGDTVEIAKCCVYTFTNDVRDRLYRL